MGVHSANKGVVVSQTTGLTPVGSEGRGGAGAWYMESATRAMSEVDFGRVAGLKVIEVLNLERISLPSRGRGHWGMTRNW